MRKAPKYSEYSSHPVSYETAAHGFPLQMIPTNHNLRIRGVMKDCAWHSTDSNIRQSNSFLSVIDIRYLTDIDNRHPHFLWPMVSSFYGHIFTSRVPGPPPPAPKRNFMRLRARRCNAQS